jgi:hypothetical protein
MSAGHRIYPRIPIGAKRDDKIRAQIPRRDRKGRAGRGIYELCRLPDINQVVTGPIRRAEAQENIAVVIGKRTLRGRTLRDGRASESPK